MARVRFLFTLLGALFLAPAAAWAANCSEETIVGAWQTEWAPEVWSFKADGSLHCQGGCDYGPKYGSPLSWAYDPEATLFSVPIDHVKLEFTAHKFEGTVGGFRCRIERDGQLLVLDPFRGDPLLFQKISD